MTLQHLVDHGSWTHAPLDATVSDGRLQVTAVEGSDAWRHTAYDMVRDSEHALLEPFGDEAALDVSFLLDYQEQYDQAGLFLRASEQEWIKAGVEVADGLAQVGAVVTHTHSDWSVAPVPSWVGREVTIRASRAGDAITLRARVDDEPFRLLRVAYLAPGTPLHAGLYCCSPSRAGLTVTFTGYTTGAPDAALHD